MKRTIVIIAATGLPTVAGCSSSSSTPDRGVSACQHYAGPPQGSDSPAVVADLKASGFADLRDAGTSEEKAFASADTGQEISAGFGLATACAHHGSDTASVSD
jgi:hypothetical protein